MHDKNSSCTDVFQEMRLSVGEPQPEDGSEQYVQRVVSVSEVTSLGALKGIGGYDVTFRRLCG